jgi:hypothetical protein
MIDYARELGFDLIHRGRDTNLYGKHLSIGIPVFKISFGFDIKPDSKSGDMLIKPNNLSGFRGSAYFLSYGKGGLVGNLIIKEGDEPDARDYLCQSVKQIRIYEQTDHSLKLMDTMGEK